MADILPQFIGGCLLCFVTGYGIGSAFRAVRQIIERASRPVK